jgi:chromosome segregation ATPase
MIASLKGYGRIARTLIVAVSALLVVGIVASLYMSVRARHNAETQAVDQARTIADRTLSLVFQPSDVSGPVDAARAGSLSQDIQSTVVDPSDFDVVTLWDPEATILYSTELGRISNQLMGETDRIKEALKGNAQTRDADGMFSVMLPLRFRSGVGGPAVVELSRADGPIASAAGPWRTNAMFLFALTLLLGVAGYVVMRVTAMSTDAAAQPGAQQPVVHQQQVQPTRPIRLPQTVIREEADARHKAEGRAQAAEERLGLLQEQYRKALEELQQYQHLSREPRGPADPRLEERALRAEGQVQTLTQQIQTLTLERERLANQLQDLTHRIDTPLADGVSPEHELLLREAELQIGGMRSKLESNHAELVDAKGALAAAQTELGQARHDLDETRTELRALRTEEQRAAMLADELRSTKAELESLQASQRAELVEREAEFEEKVRATREEFQRQLEEFETSYQGQVGQKEADLIGRITQAENEAREAVRELESARSEVQAARAEAAGREQRLIEATDELSGKRREIATLQAEIKERSVSIAQTRKEADDMRRSLVGLQADLVRADGSVTAMRTELEAEQARADELQSLAATSESARHALEQRVDNVTRQLEDAVGENAELNRRLQEVEARRQLELADDPARAQIDELLRVTQERLAGQTEKLISAEDRVKELEATLVSANEKIEVVEGELRTHQMSEALREMREHEAPEPAAAREDVVVATTEDRRAATPFLNELSLDAKKTLSRIGGITQLMKHKKDTKDQAQLIKQLTTYTRRLEHTVTDLAEADNLARGAVDLQVRNTDLEALVNRVVEEADIAGDYDLRIVAEPVKLRVDQTRTEQILGGLLRYTDERTSSGETIIVRLQNMDGGALLSVEDPQPSAEATISPVVRRFAEVQGGWAKIEARENGGTAFRVFLPDAASPARASSGAPADLAPELQIVVDESPDTVQPEESFEAQAGRILSEELRRLAERNSGH